MRNAAAEPLAPNMPDYERARREFSWAVARDLLSGLPFGRGLNIAHEAVDRHALSDRVAHVAIRAISGAGKRRDITYEELSGLSSRFANLLEHLPIAAGDRVFVLLP
jgi:acetyl-CoA synthetase